MVWKTPEMIEIKMDAEISSYQDDGRDPLKDGPLFVEGEPPVDASRVSDKRPVR